MVVQFVVETTESTLDGLRLSSEEESANVVALADRSRRPSTNKPYGRTRFVTHYLQLPNCEVCKFMKIAPSSVQELPGNARTPLSLFGDGIEAEQKIIDEETNLVRSIATQSWCRTFFWFIDVSQGKLWRKRWTVCNSFCRKIRHRVWFIQMPSPPTWLQIRIFWRV